MFSCSYLLIAYQSGGSLRFSSAYFLKFELVVHHSYSY
jgi:hypothetical protein